MGVYFLPTGKKDDEMDPMDPSAYSDAPRYIPMAAATIRQVFTLFCNVKVMYIKCSFLLFKSPNWQFDEFYRKYLYFNLHQLIKKHPSIITHL